MAANENRPPVNEIALVRELVSQLMEYAVSDECEVRRQRWRDVNELRKPDRAPVWCRVAAARKEILPEDELQCEHALCRSLERTLRYEVYKIWVGDDHIAAPWWPVRAVMRCTTDETWGMPGYRSIGTTDMGGFKYDHPVKDVADYDRVTVPDFEYDAEATARNASQVADILGEVMPVRIEGGPPLSPQLQVYWEHLRGMGPMMEDLAFAPEACHRLMARLTEGVLRGQRRAEEAGILTTNHHEPMYCSDPLGEVAEGEPVRLCNLWSSANSQEFDTVGPPMFEEFLFSYQRVLFQAFGRVQYGCCEDLTTKIDRVLRLPNLRIFVSSFWTDIEKVAEACGTDYCIMWRQSAAQVTVPDDLDEYRAHFDRGLRVLQGQPYQVVLREIETVRGDANRLRDWARISIEIAEKYA